MAEKQNAIELPGSQQLCGKMTCIDFIPVYIVDAKFYSLTMDGPRSTSSSTISSSGSLSDQKPAHNRNVDPEDIRSTRVVPEVIGIEVGSGNCSSAVNGRCNAELGAVRGATSQEAQTHHQMTPSKRRTILNISPPPEDLLDDSRMSCQDEAPLDSELSNSIWMDDSLSNFSVMSTSSYNDNTEVPRKSRKRTPRQRPGPKAAPAANANTDVFDADSANGPHFVLSQLGPDTKTGSKGRFVVSLTCFPSIMFIYCCSLFMPAQVTFPKMKKENAPYGVCAKL